MESEIAYRSYCPFCDSSVAVQAIGLDEEGRSAIKWIIAIVMLIALFFFFKFGWDESLSVFLAQKLKLGIGNSAMLIKMMPFMITALVGGGIGYIFSLFGEGVPMPYRCKECGAILNDGIWHKRINKTEVKNN